MEESVYRAPQAPLVAESAQQLPMFYVVSVTKFWILFVATFGLYCIYWFYRHWGLYKRYRNSNEMPVWRGIFNIFFAHSLFRNINDRRPAGVRLDWAPELMATVYVVASIASSVLSRVAGKDIGSPFTDIASFVCLGIAGWAMLDAQRAANAVCGDPAATQNNSFTWANWLWIALGGLMWMIVALGTVLLMLDDGISS